MKAITNGRIITPEGIKSGVVLFDEGIIKGIVDSVPEGVEVIDAGGNYVSPGFIDIHIHGGGGADYLDSTPEAYLTTTRELAKHGATLLFPTIMTANTEALYETIEAYREAQKRNDCGASMGGIHIEGPYFNPAKAGAQDRRYIRNPKREEYCEILDRCPEIVRWDFAPELEGTVEFAKELTSRGVIASIAHTEASFEECEAVYNAGANIMTHFYACMSTLHKKGLFRYAGAVEYGYYQDGMNVEIIADGFHVQPAILKTVIKVKGVDRIALVTDSMRAAGMPEGPNIFGSLTNGFEVLVEGGIAMLKDRSALASSVATCDCLIRTILRDTDCTIEQAVQMASANPARFMKVYDRTGSIEAGKDADIIIFDEGINVKRTIVKGRTVHVAE